MSEIVLIEKWLNIMLNTISVNKFGPTVTARFQYLVSTIMYYAYASFKNIKSTKLTEPELKFIYIRESSLDAVDVIIQQSMIYLFNQLGLDNAALVAPNYSINIISKRVVDNLKLFLDRRHNDNHKKANEPVPLAHFPNQNLFINVNDFSQNLTNLDPHTWTPLKHGNAIQKYLTPYWGNVQSVENISLDKYIKIADDNYNVPNKDKNRELEIAEILKFYESLDDSQRMIAEYFQGGKVTPPGIWNIIALYTIKSINIQPILAFEFLYLLNTTMFMSSVVAWGVKFKYMQARPIQEIRLLNNKNVTTFDGTIVNCKSWKTFQQQNFQTPPFPDYISGHSTFSGGAATIFEKYFPQSFNSINFIPFTNQHGGLITPLLANNDYVNTVKVAMLKNGTSDVIHTDSTLKFPTCAVKLTFNSWRELANLSGISRIYGGIHGNNANNAGLIIGECIAIDILSRK